MNPSSLFNIFSKNNKTHWEKIYNKHSPDKVGWYQERPEISLKFIANTQLGLDANIIDVGGGASRLSALLFEEGYINLTVFDISSQALRAAQQSLGVNARKINWIEGDITSYAFDEHYDVWHDRAVFHFLTEKADRKNYLKTLDSSLSAHGHFIISTFGPQAPAKCSGLPVVRYSAKSLHKEIGNRFELIDSTEEQHTTPGNTLQNFIYCHFIRTPK